MSRVAVKVVPFEGDDLDAPGYAVLVEDVPGYFLHILARRTRDEALAAVEAAVRYALRYILRTPSPGESLSLTSQWHQGA